MKKILCLIFAFMLLLTACNEAITDGASNDEPAVSDNSSASSAPSRPESPSEEENSGKILLRNVSGNIDFGYDRGLNYDLDINVYDGMYFGTLTAVIPQKQFGHADTLDISVCGNDTGRFYDGNDIVIEYLPESNMGFIRYNCQFEEINGKYIIYSPIGEYQKMLAFSEENETFYFADLPEAPDISSIDMDKVLWNNDPNLFHYPSLDWVYPGYEEE